MSEYITKLRNHFDKTLNSKRPLQAKPKVPPMPKNDEEWEAFAESITPKRGIHYFDGIHGRDGVDGKHGRDGRDGEPGKRGAPGRRGEKGEPGEPGSPDTPEIILEKLLMLSDEHLGKLFRKKLKLGDIESLEDRLVAAENNSRVRHGGHGGTLKELTATTSDNQTYTFATTDRPQFSELWVIRAGAIQDSIAGDFTYVLVQDRVKSITLATPLQGGEVIRFRGK